MSENPYKDRRLIDKMVDYRKHFAPGNYKPIRIKLTPTEMLTALGYPVPRPPHPPEAHCTYRGYRLEATLTVPAP